MNISKKRIVVLTGAGISAESGIKTFRDNDGLWEDHRIEEVATPEAFQRDPELVHRFYNLRREQLKEVTPNSAHIALAELEALAKKFTLVTQNVDDLHERAGSKNVLHIHGELRKIRDLTSNKSSIFEGSIEKKDYLKLRPDIVWFGESVKYTFEIDEAISDCDLFLCIGTSNVVYPAAGLVHTAKYNKARCVELNLEETPLSSLFDQNIFGRAGEIVPHYISSLL